MKAVMKKIDICATAGIGTNLYLAKIAMDIVAKHVPEHIGILTEYIKIRSNAHDDRWNEAIII
jgi:nucleotidyltransferase/DNA polymerase involved in DNA repair